MTCQECELLLAQDEANDAVEAHVAECEECRGLASELVANSFALAAMRDEVLPVAAMVRRPSRRWAWVAAGAVAATLLIAAMGLRQQSHGVPAPAPEVAKVLPAAPPVEAAVPEQPVRKRRLPPKAKRKPAVALAEPMLVKFLTDDPDVVIYWVIDGEKSAGAL